MSNELSTELSDRIVAKYRPGEESNNISAALKVLQTSVGSEEVGHDPRSGWIWSAGFTEPSREKGPSERVVEEPDGT